MRDKIIEIEKYSFIGNDGVVRDIRLEADGSVDDPNRIVAAWTYLFDKGRNVDCIQLYDGKSMLLGLLTEDRAGVWKGRDRKTKGTIVLDPCPEGRRIEKKSKPVKEEFHYIEPLPRQLDWSRGEYDIRELIIEDGLQSREECGIIIGWNRLDYFRETVQSIAQNSEAQEIPFFVFLDKCDNPKVTYDQMEIVKEHFRWGYVIKRPINFGCGRNIIDARHQVFDNLEFKRTWVFEDDLVVAPNYMSYVNSLMGEAEEKYPNVGAVQGWKHCTMALGEKEVYRDSVCSTYENWWGYLMKKEAWDSMREFLFSFRDLFLGGLYAMRPHKSIVRWFQIYMKKQREQREGYVEGEMEQNSSRHYFDAPPSGQDAATMIGFYQAGWTRLAPLVNRARYIGKHGIHMNRGHWERAGFDNVILDALEEKEECQEASWLSLKR